jgi:hypothetical protein
MKQILENGTLQECEVRPIYRPFIPFHIQLPFHTACNMLTQSI